MKQWDAVVIGGGHNGLVATRARAAADALLHLARQQAMHGVGPVLLSGDGCPHT